MSAAEPVPSPGAARDGHGSRRLLAVLVDELVRGGVTDAVTSPGSRNAPLLQAIVAHGGLRARSVVDERSAGFVALGIAKATGRPAVVCCTSGSAAAHLLPAIVEAHHARVPLVVLTADRPAELHGVGAGQTVEQRGIFGPATRLAHDLANDTADRENLRRARALAARLLQAAEGQAGGGPGPVHVNVPLREPLVGPAEAAAAGRHEGAPWVRRHGGPGVDEAAVSALGALLLRHRRAVVVAGRHEHDPQLGPATAALCELLGLPLLADPLSGARRGRAAIGRYDALLRTPAAVPPPELVVRLGDLPTSKPLRAWLAGLPDDVPQVHVSEDGAWQDPDGALSDVVAAPPRALLEAVAPRLTHAEPDAGWLARWQALDVAVVAAQDALLDAPADGAEAPAVSEPWLARELPALLPPAATLLVAASMPIRDVEGYMAPRPALRVLANRGANGIDGTIATAWGLALAREPGDGPVCVLIGDVALQHDVGSLLAAGRAGTDLTVVVVDNDGGGIFDFLPVAEQDDPALQRHVTTPTGLDLPAIAAAADASLRPVARPDELVGALRAAVAEPRTSLLHVRTERRANRLLHDELARAAAEAAGAA